MSVSSPALHRQADSWRDIITVYTGFLAVTFAVLWPLPTAFGTSVPGDNGDVMALLWDFWWLPFALGNGLNPFHTDLLLAPWGVDLIFHTNCFVPVLFSFPAYALAGLAAAWNATIVLAFSLAGLGFYLFCREFGCSRPASLIAGYAYAFCPFVFGHLPGHLSLLQTHFVAFALFFSLRALRASRFDWKSALGLGVSVWATAVTDFNLFAAIIFLSPAIAACVLLEDWRQLHRRAPWLTLLAAAAVAVCLAIPWIAAYLNATRSHSYVNRRFWSGAEVYNTPQMMLVPPVFHTMWGKYFNPGANAQPGFYAEKGAYLGWVSIILAIIAFARRPRSRVVVWVILLLLLCNLSLGNRWSPLAQGKWKWVLLGRFWPKIAFFDQIRSPGRFAFPAQAAIAILAAFGFDAIRAQLRRTWVIALFACVLALMVIDHLYTPIPIKAVPQPSRLYEQAGIRGEGTILVFPIGVAAGGGGDNTGTFVGKQLIDQMEHRKPIVSAYVSRLPNDVLDQIMAHPVPQAIISLQSWKAPGPVATSAVRDYFRAANIRWVVLPPPHRNQPQLTSFLKTHLPIREYRAFDEADVLYLGPL